MLIWNRFVPPYFNNLWFQDGTERVIESLPLIDAVMPDVVESRKQAAAKAHQIKTENANTNGEDASHSLGE